MRTIRLVTLERWNTERGGHYRDRQIAAAREALAEHPEAVILECADEMTGHRFERRRGRRGLCRKIGQSAYKYQLWASWAPHDIARADIAEA